MFRNVRRHAATTSSVGHRNSGGGTYKSLLPHYFNTDENCLYAAPIVVHDATEDGILIGLLVFGDFGASPNFQIQLESEPNLRNLGSGNAVPLSNEIVETIISTIGGCSAASEFVDYAKHYKGKKLYIIDGNMSLSYDRDQKATLYVNGEMLESGIEQTSPVASECCE